MSDQSCPSWVMPLMRIGYLARGGTYVVVGVLACLAAYTGSDAGGTQEALASLRSVPWGLAALWVLAFGLFAYAIWRFLDAAMDLEDYGTDGKGIVARIGLAVSGIIHAGLGVTAFRLATGSGSNSGEGGGGTQTLASWLLSMPAGQWIVAAAGLITIGAGGYYAWKGIAEKYKKHIRSSEWSRKLEPVIKAGLVAHGAVIAIIGGFLIYAGMTANPEQAGGIGKAFDAVRSQPFGQALLWVLALGMIAFAVYCVIEARYRIVPRCADPDIRSMAAKARAAAT